MNQTMRKFREIQAAAAWLCLILALALTVTVAAPAAAQALTFKIANESGRAPQDVYVTVAGEDATYDVPGMVDDAPKKLSEIPGQELTINKLIAGRVYISYGAGVTVSVPFNSPTRFDWAELTVIPSASDVANLTAVDQFGIAMRLDTFNAAGHRLESLGAANSDTIFNALQQVPGGPAATIRDAEGHIIRVLSPLHSASYPDLGPYVRSMAGKTITLHTAFFGNPFTTTVYSGTFAADGSIALHGTTNPLSSAPATIEIPGEELIKDIYTGGNTPNNVEGTIRRDLLAGFSAGFWGGRYGNDALSFCTDPVTTGQGSWCPNGFNQPAFGDARTTLPAFPTCEQYAAVINQYSDVYGNPYSDASKRVTVGLDQPGTGGEVSKLELTILPDSGTSKPVSEGNANCGAGSGEGGEGGGGVPGGDPVPAPGPAPAANPVSTTGPGPVSATSPTPRPTVKFLKRGKFAKGRATARVAQVSCPSACGRIRVVAAKGQKVVGRAKLNVSVTDPWVGIALTGAGRRMLARERSLGVSVTLRVEPVSGPAVQVHRQLTLVAS